MIRKVRYSWIIVVAFITMVSCSEYDALGPSVLDTTPPPRTALDNWILEHLTKPYNIEVTYRWHYTESDLSRYLTPATEDKVEGFVKILNAIWTDPYVAIAGRDFFNNTCPKQVLLSGSSAYLSSGSTILGTAESGRKVVLYEVNNFDRKNAARLKAYMKTIHHEYTHIQNQIHKFDPEYELITASGYRTDYNNVTAQAALNNGFITAYSCVAPAEDFAEMVGVMLTSSVTQWNNLLNMPNNDTAKENLKKKEAMVIKYYKESWGFDILALQDELERAIDKVVNE